MSIKATLLCINGDKTQLEGRKLFLESNQYRVLTANTEQDALLLVTERRVDAIVLECTDDFAVAERLKRVSSRVPIIAIVNNLDPPHLDADAIDALVASFDGPQFFLETLHFLLKVRPSQNCIGDTQSIRNRFAKSTVSAWKARIGI
jgi:CheY-like chemotaxis protein